MWEGVFYPEESMLREVDPQDEDLFILSRAIREYGKRSISAHHDVSAAYRVRDSGVDSGVVQLFPSMRRRL